MAIIKKIKAREILDSRGNPTIEVDVQLKNNGFGRFSVPSGASVGQHEAWEMRDCNPNRFRGKGVLKSIKIIENIIAPKIINVEFYKIKYLDNLLLNLDNTKNKSILGANSILGVSIATAKAMANENGLSFFQYLNPKSNLMPTPLMNILNGGIHADNNLSIQEFMIIPNKAHTFKEAIQHGVEVFHALKDILIKNKLSTTVGDEGGFAPYIRNTNEACEYLIKAIRLAGFIEGKDISLAIDAASSQFYNSIEDVYTIDNVHFKSNELVEFWIKLCKNYPIVSIEDPCDENDWNAWKNITKKLGKNIQIVGDDLFATNLKLLNKGIEKKLANSLLVKFNQIGTLSETLDAIELAKKANFTYIISHRSGETEDTTIADLAVGTNSGQIKTGSLSRSDRISKYNRLIRIEEILGSSARYISPFKIK